MPQWVTKRHLDTKDDRLQTLDWKQNKLYNPKNKRGPFAKYLLCQTCESNFAKLDEYASLYFKDTIETNLKSEKLSLEHQEGYPPALCFKFDHLKIRKFIISVILRFYYCDIDESKIGKRPVSLSCIPRNYIDFLRAFLENSDINNLDLDYSTTFSYLLNLNDGLKHSYMEPVYEKDSEFQALAIFFNIGEYHFIQFVSPYMPPELKKRIFLHPSKTLSNKTDKFMCLPGNGDSLNNHIQKSLHDLNSA